MRIVKSDKVIHSFGVHDPVATVQNGEEFWVECRDCYDGQVQSQNDRRSQMDTARLMPMTGPIQVEGAMPGTSLRIEILDIEPFGRGFMPMRPGMGILGSEVKEETTFVLPIDPETGTVRLGRFSVTLRPMIGAIGTAPSDRYVPSRDPGPHGGNLDSRDVQPGATLWLPVFVEGGLLALGDLHAVQGSGELCGQAVEMSGRVKLRVWVSSGILNRPRVETADSWIMYASAATLEEALRVACLDTVDFICKTYGASFDEAYRLLSIAGNGGISQVANALVTAQVAFPKGLA